MSSSPKPIPPGYTFEQALTSGFVGRMEDRGYMDWVKTLPCSGCGDSHCAPHHMHGRGFKGMGTKVPDYLTMPLCRHCHDELHRNVTDWENRNGEQILHISMTLMRAIYEGKLKFHA